MLRKTNTKTMRFRQTVLMSIIFTQTTAFLKSFPYYHHCHPVHTTIVLHGGGGDGVLVERNAERIKTAGKRGSKRFVDPCKIFIGNLSFHVKKDDVKAFFKQNLGTTFNVKSIKIIYDWKTGQSKGYGFVIFTDPMFATVAIETCHGKELFGRNVTCSQGKKKQDEIQVYIKSKGKIPTTREEQVIQKGLQETNNKDNNDQEMDYLDDTMGDEINVPNDNDDDFDGMFEEMYPNQYEPLSEEEQNLNRKQRREIQRRKKKRKLPHKGFLGTL